MKTTLITGASSDFGYACVEAFIQEGYKVTTLAKRKDRLDKLKAKYRDQIHVLYPDVREQEEIFKAVGNLPNDFKEIDVFFNNTGLALDIDEFDKLSIEDIDTMVDTNIEGLLYVARAIVPVLRKQKSAYVFSLGSVAARNLYLGGDVCCGAKASAERFSRVLRSDSGGENIKVTDIVPRPCKVGFSEVRFKGDKAKADAVYEGTRYISTQDITRVMMSIANLPSHVNVSEIELMPVTQTWNGFYIEQDQ